ETPESGAHEAQRRVLEEAQDGRLGARRQAVERAQQEHGRQPLHDQEEKAQLETLEGRALVQRRAHDEAQAAPSVAVEPRRLRYDQLRDMPEEPGLTRPEDGPPRIWRKPASGFRHARHPPLTTWLAAPPGAPRPRRRRSATIGCENQ